MKAIRNTKTWAALLLAICLAGALPAAAQPATPETQEEFVPASQLPAVEQMPAAPMVVAAYGFVWIALLVYVWSIWRRMQHVERDIAELARRVEAAQE